MSRPKSLALAGLVAALTLTVSSVALAAPPKGATTSTGTVSTTPRKSPRATPATKVRVPAKAERLLKRLLKAAAAVSADDEQVAVLSERYDVYKYKLSRVELDVTTLGLKVRRDDAQLFAAAARLRNAAVVAYVSGELTENNATALLDDQSESQMAEVYSGIALGELTPALGHYRAASRAASSAGSRSR